MLNFNNLPFPRGDTFEGGSGMTLSSVTLDHLVGATFVVPDDQHDTGAEVVLRLVKNDSGSAITAANQVLRFGTDAKDFARYVDGTTNVRGMVGLPIDDAYTASYSIADDDYFYVVERGPCNIKSEASAVSLVAGEPVTPDASGRMDGTIALETDFILGTIDTDASATSTNYLVWVQANLWNPQGSGT